MFTAYSIFLATFLASFAMTGGMYSLENAVDATNASDLTFFLTSL